MAGAAPSQPQTRNRGPSARGGRAAVPQRTSRSVSSTSTTQPPSVLPPPPPPPPSDNAPADEAEIRAAAEFIRRCVLASLPSNFFHQPFLA